MMTRRVWQPWYCEGCKLHHSVSVRIEGDSGGRYWCATAIRDGIKARRNDLPRYDSGYGEDPRKAFTTELTPEGEQYVIPGAEKRTTREKPQGELFG